jgi:PKD repeat protein
VDSAANSYEGWVVDDVMVTADGFGPVAAAGGPYSGYKRQPIAFDGSASFDRDGDPLAFAWDFGDGTTGNGPRPSHAYSTAGTFTVKLVVTDGVGTSPAATTTVTVQNRLPVARPGGPYAGLKGEAIAFSGADSSDPDGDPLTWSWAFGDGTYGTGPTPTHAYAKVGTFTVYLTVHDGTASSSQVWTTAKVTDATPPSPVSNLAATATTNRSVTLAWTATGDDGGAGTAASYDLRYSTEPLTEESFATAFAVQDEPAPRTSGSAESLTVGSLLPGTTYHFALKATDAAGNVSPLSNVAPVTTAPGVVVLRDDFEGGLGGWTVAGANGAGGGSLWHLSPHRVNSPTQAAYYGVEGSRTYNTGYRNHGTLTSGAIDLRGAARPVLSLQHFLQKQASASLDTARLQVSTDAGGTWTTLAGFPSAVPRMSRLEADLSAYNRSVVRLRFEFDTVDASANDYEGWVVDDVMITADGLGPVAAPGGPYSGWKRQPVAFDGSQSLDPQGDPLAFAWDFGDGTTGEGPTPTHAYETAGTFTVTLTVSDGTQVSPAATTTVSVPNRAPLAHPGGPYAGTRGEAIAFSGAASSDPDGDPITFLWLFGDGTGGSGPSPTHAYAKGGTFTVSLIVNDGAVPSTEATTTATVADSIPPSPVSNLAAPATTNRSVTLAWTATGDDGVTGTAARYDVRYSAVPPTEATFAAAFQVPNEAPPRPAGMSESLTVGSLLPGTTYHFALRVLDAAGNASALSNVVSVTTAPGVVVFRDDFEAGLGGWTASGADGKGGSALWHASPHRVSSPTRAAYYGIEATKTYDTGARNYGSITSGPIDLRGLSGPVLSFQHFLQKELASSYDVARVLVQTAEGGAWTTLATLASQDTRIMSPFEIDLSAYAQGSVRLRFDLDTMDAWGNGYEGWVVDDVMVTARAAGTPP